MSRLPHGSNLKKVLRDLRTRGCDVQKVRRTGEIRVRHPSAKKPVRVNGRRKDAPRELTSFLRKLLL